jgi:hypothetical protein
MSQLSRSDEIERLVDATLLAAVKFIQNYADNLDGLSTPTVYNDAKCKRLIAKRALRMAVQRPMRSYDPNLHSRVTLSIDNEAL